MYGKIFVQIAAYRDPELLPTLRDCLAKAKWPENLVFSICWQHNPEDAWDNLDEFSGDPRFKVIDIDWMATRGTSWARNTLQQQYDGEPYTLQLDSHHRFVDNWDEQLLEMFHALVNKGVKKPLITGYIPSYQPSTDPEGRVMECWKMSFNRFAPENQYLVIHTHPSLIPVNDMSAPLLGRFYSAHFAFSWGSFVTEVPHDPLGYFHGEEPGISVRAWTWGYDIYHPNKIIAWHYYYRNAPTHWGDHASQGVRWNRVDQVSKMRFKKMLGIGDGEPKDLKEYGLGPVRSLEDYERFSGIRFRDWRVQKYTLDERNPPNPYYALKKEYDASFLPFYRFCIDIGWSDGPAQGRVDKTLDYDFWAVDFQDADGKQIPGSRQDSGRDEIERMKVDKDGYAKVWRNFFYEDGREPHSWVVWPHCSDPTKGDNGYMERLTGRLVFDDNQKKVEEFMGDVENSDTKIVAINRPPDVVVPIDGLPEPVLIIKGQQVEFRTIESPLY